MGRLPRVLSVLAIALVACTSTSSGTPVAASSDGGADSGKVVVVGDASEAGDAGDTGTDAANWSAVGAANGPDCPASWAAATPGAPCPLVGVSCSYDIENGQPGEVLFCEDGPPDAASDAGGGHWIGGE